MEIGKMYINSESVDALSGNTITVLNPANGEIVGYVPSCGQDDIDLAVASAKAAFPTWSHSNPFERGRLLRKASQHIFDNAQRIATLLTMEQGKPYAEALGEVRKGGAILQFYAEEAERIYGTIIPNEEGTDYISNVIYQPIGVCACISPWNYPIELLAWKIGACMAAGCTCVLKIPSLTPFSPITFIADMMKAGFPKGVINLITGKGPEVGDYLVGHPDIKKIAFTGSTPVGRHIMEVASKTTKRLSLELGGSLPMIVCKDCDLDAAVKGAIRRKFRNMGQICIAINRIYVERDIYEEFLCKYTDKAKQLVIGNGLDDGVNFGPLCTKKGVETCIHHVDDALKKGARLMCGGKRPEGLEFEAGNFYEPTILADVSHEMLVMTEETFGPVVGVMPFDTVDEAIALANDSCYGLAAIAYTKSLCLAARFANEINAGNVAINNVDAGVINAPYGGWNDSGFGHEHGKQGLMEYLHIKHVRIYMA